VSWSRNLLRRRFAEKIVDPQITGDSYAGHGCASIQSRALLTDPSPSQRVIARGTAPPEIREVTQIGGLDHVFLRTKTTPPETSRCGGSAICIGRQ